MKTINNHWKNISGIEEKISLYLTLRMFCIAKFKGFGHLNFPKLVKNKIEIILYRHEEFKSYEIFLPVITNFSSQCNKHHTLA